MSSEEPLRHQYRAALSAQADAATGHPDESLWERVICEEASAEEREQVREHAIRCSACAETYQALLELGREAAAIDAGVPAASGRAISTGRPWTMYAIAAGIVLAASLTPFVWRAWQQGESSSPAAGRVEVRAPLSANAVFRVEKAPVMLSASLALTPRGAADDRRRFMDEFGRAIALYRADDFPEAAARLIRLSDAHPEVVEPALYAGISLLLSQRPAEAVMHLERAQARATPEFLAEIDWHLALAYVHAGQIEKSTDLLKRVCSGTGPHRDRGCAAVKVVAEGR